MLKFTGHDRQGDKVFFLGLSRENLNRLAQCEPIKVNLSDMQGPNATVVILFGETEQMLFSELKYRGLIPPEVTYPCNANGEPVNKVLIRDGKPTEES